MRRGVVLVDRWAVHMFELACIILQRALQAFGKDGWRQGRVRWATYQRKNSWFVYRNLSALDAAHELTYRHV